MAGLLAGAMLRTDASAVWEAQEDLPNNHSALLRFRSQIVASTLNIPFKRVQVMKASDSWRNPVADAFSYSRKTNGSATIRSSTTAQGQIEERFVAPHNLIEQMADRVQAPILLGKKFTREDIGGSKPFISTLPMPILADLLGVDHPEFNWVNGYNINVNLDRVDAYATLYVPSPDNPANRISITGNKMTIEVSLPSISPSEVAAIVAAKNKNRAIEDIKVCLELMGLDPFCFVEDTIEVKQQQYSKILPIDDRWRKDFIMKASREYNIYSLGRFATWRPGLLLDDVVNDVRVISNIARYGQYDHSKG